MSRILVSTIVALTILAAAPPAAASSTATVCASGCDFTSIQAAIDAAAPGDTIVVRPGAYAESIVIDRSLTVCGTGSGGSACNVNAADPVLDTAAIYPVLISADDVVFRGFTIDNADFTTVDSIAGRVDVSAIVVFGADRVTVSDVLIESIASVPLAGEGRWKTIGVNIGEGATSTDRSDDVTIARVEMQNMPPPRGLGNSSCTDCEVFGILNWARGTGFTAEDNDIRMQTSAEPAFGIAFDRNPSTEIRGNFIRMPSSAPGSGPTVVGIDAGVTDGAVIAENDIAVTLTSTPGGLYGVWGIFSNTEFTDNLVQLAQHGIALRTSAVGGNELRQNEFRTSAQGILNYADHTLIENNVFTNMAQAAIVLDAVDAPGGPYSSSQDVTIALNTFSGGLTNLLITDTVENSTFDARKNDWGVYTAEDIRERIDDATGTNDVDIRCFIDEDGVTQVCPQASFTTQIGTSWPRVVTFTDTSLFSGSEMASREWILPDGESAVDPVVTVSLNPGSYSVSLEVTDGEGFTSSASDAFVLSNTAPSFALAGPYAATEGALLSFGLGATDAEGDSLVYTVLQGPAGLSVAGGVLSWTPGHASAGSHPITIRVSDGNLDVASSASIDVTDVPAGAPLDPIANVNILELGSATRAVRAVSPAGAPITLTATGLPAGATFTDNGNGQGTFAITAPSGSAASSVVTIEAVSEGITTTKTFNVVVTKSVAFTLERLTGTTVLVSPGTVQAISARVTNTGSGTDTIRFSVATTRAWAVTTPADLTLAPGASAIVTVMITVPANGDASFVTLNACSATVTTLCKNVRTHVQVPLVIDLAMESEWGLLDTIGGTVTVTHLDGSAATGVSVVFSERHAQNVFLLASETSGSTDGTGAWAFEDGDLMANVPGDHDVVVTATRGESTASLPSSYSVGP